MDTFSLLAFEIRNGELSITPVSFLSLLSTMDLHLLCESVKDSNPQIDDISAEKAATLTGQSNEQEYNCSEIATHNSSLHLCRRG